MDARWALAVVAAAMTASPIARADTVRDCIGASNAGQEARKSGRLYDAAQDFAQCSRASCPGVVRRDCARWVEEVELATPTVVFAATDAQGRDRSDVRVFVDGSKLLDRLDGQPLSVDPGVHTVRYEGADGAVGRQELVARAGEKNRIVSIRLESPVPRTAPTPPPKKNPPRPLPLLPLALGGVSLAALGVAGYFDFSATGDAHTLRATCDQRCSPSDVDSIDTKYRVAAVALGVGVVAAGVALVLFLTSHDEPASRGSSAATFTVDSPGPLSDYR